MKYSCKCVVLTIAVVVSVGVVHINAQPVLERISITERGDGLGYVVRFHLTGPAERFITAQPENNLVQVGLFNINVNYSTPEHAIIESFSQIDLENGAGFEFRIDVMHNFISNAYLDVNGSDILL